MNVHYVIWVALAVAAMAAVYGTYNYLLFMSVNYFVSSTEEVLKNLASVQPGEEKSAVIAVPWGVKIEACQYNPITGMCNCRGDSGLVREKNARGCLKIATQDRVAYIGTPYPVELRGQTELFTGVYQIRASTQPPNKACTTVATLLGRQIGPIQESVNSQEVCNLLSQAEQALDALEKVGLQSDLKKALEELSNQCSGQGAVQTLIKSLWTTFCTQRIIITVER